MRPIKLTLQAFGPYAGKEEIDFSRLGNRTMFVICGKTGSGKTTIFDGISYAIYGKASGEDRNGPELRSHFANEETLTEVSLEFTLKGRRYYIWRSPQQYRKKKSGEGLTLVPAKAELYQYDEKGNKQLLGANVRDVDERIKEIMKIDSNQFRQILMIPQGEFRKLLTSDSKEKEVILQRLFHTEIYKRIEEKLKEEATELKRQVEKQSEDRDIAIRSIQAVYNEELISMMAADSVYDALILPQLRREIEAMDAKLIELKGEIREKQTQRDKLQQSIYEAEMIIKQLKAKEELREKKEELEKQKEWYVKKEEEIFLGQKAALLAKQEEICHHLKANLDQLQANSASLNARVSELASLLKKNMALYEAEKAKEPQRQKASDEVKRLLQMKEDVYSFANMKKLVHNLKQELLKAQSQQKQAQEEIVETEEQLKNLRQEKQLIEQSQLLFLENKRKIELYDDEIEQLGKYESFFQRLEKAKAVFETKKGSYEKAVAHLEDGRALQAELELKWLHNQAAILAGSLDDGKPCPVCGSTHHPSPALAGGGAVVSEEDIKAAKQQVQLLEREKGKAESNVYEAQSQKKALEAALSELREEIRTNRPDFSDERLVPLKRMIQHEREKLVKNQSELAARINKLKEVSQQLENGEKHRDHLNDTYKQATERIQELTVQYTEKRTMLERMIEQIPEDLRTIAAYENALKQATEEQKQLENRFERATQLYQETREAHATEKARLETVDKQVQETAKKLDEEREAFKQKLAEQGFSKYSEYHEAKRTEAELAQLGEMVRSYREELRSVTDRYLELADLLKDVKKPDLAALQAEFAEVGKQLELLQNESTNLLMKKSHNLNVLEKVERINEQLHALEEKYKLVGHLYDIAKGQNTYRITFERFVLAAFLDDILEHANTRLIKMTSGRYQLLRKTDRSKGGGQSGLELLVFDQYTSQERHVKTLSGGESFKAALSLALGLAEVVQQYAGGVSLETMFIDEGFGTLDPESLDQAIESLIDIQNSGRLVGIISHVPELKERIDARLEVIATQTGSRTEFQLLN
jgi:exonuclease SbcC